MSDWLSKIEKRLKGYSKYRASWPTNVDKDRMARVIRELKVVADAADWVWNELREDDDAGGYSIYDVKCVPALRKALNNLSPDAKELLK